MIFPVSGRGRPRQRHVPDQVSVADETIMADMTGRSVTWRQGPGGAVGVLRHARRALRPPPDDQSHREPVRHGAAPDRADQGRALANHRQADGVQARDGGREILATSEG
jgi:hypothetical protein